MRKIYKYELGVNGDITTIEAPIERILTVQWQSGTGPVLWAIIDTDKEEQEIDIVALGTGWDVSKGVQEYIGTVQDGFGYVWHYFVIKLDIMQNDIEKVKDAFAVLAQSLGKVGVSAEEASKAFDMTGLFDACM